VSKRSRQTATLLCALLFCSRADPRASTYTCGWSGRAAAHGGETAQALSIVASDARGPTLVRLNEGLARRHGEGFRYVCPARWGDDAVVPAQAIPNGPAVIGASSGLFLMREDGSVERHPDSDAAGRVLALAAGPDAVFALRAAEFRELLEVRADSVRVLWRAPEPWEDLALGPDFVSLLRVAAGRVIELRLSLRGDVLAEISAPIDARFVNVRARVAGARSYALLMTSALSFELGRVEPERWVSLANGQNIAGPIEASDGRSLLALDGRLARLEGEQVMALDESARVNCLARLAEVRYACSEGGLRRVEVAALGAPLFALSTLLEPDLSGVPDAEHATCMLQWQRYTIDLVRVGIRPGSADAGAARESDAALPDAGLETDGVDGGAECETDSCEPSAPDAAQAPDAGQATPDEQTVRDDTDEAEREPEEETRRPLVARAQRDSCQLGREASGMRFASAALVLLTLLKRRRRRRCRAAQSSWQPGTLKA
jgi:hypothetical protein